MRLRRPEQQGKMGLFFSPDESRRLDLGEDWRRWKGMVGIPSAAQGVMLLSDCPVQYFMLLCATEPEEKATLLCSIRKRFLGLGTVQW